MRPFNRSGRSPPCFDLFWPDSSIILFSGFEYNDNIFQDFQLYFHLISFNIILPQTAGRYPTLYNIYIKTLGGKSIYKYTLKLFWNDLSKSARKFQRFSFFLSSNKGELENKNHTFFVMNYNKSDTKLLKVWGFQMDDS